MQDVPKILGGTGSRNRNPVSVVVRKRPSDRSKGVAVVRRLEQSRTCRRVKLSGFRIESERADHRIFVYPYRIRKLEARSIVRRTVNSLACVGIVPVAGAGDHKVGIKGGGCDAVERHIARRGIPRQGRRDGSPGFSRIRRSEQPVPSGSVKDRVVKRISEDARNAVCACREIRAGDTAVYVPEGLPAVGRFEYSAYILAHKKNIGVRIVKRGRIGRSPSPRA